MVVDFIYNEDIDVDASKRSNSFVKPYITLPKAGEFLYGKFLTLMDGTRRPYMQVTYYDYLSGDDPKKDTRMHFSLKSADPSAKDPISDAYWDAMKARKKLKDQGDNSSPEFQRLERNIKSFRPKTGGILLFVEKGGKTIKPLFVKETFLDKLFGRKAIPALNKTEITGVINELKADGINPFSVKNPTGWLKLWKTGSGLETEFHVALDKEYVMSTVNGKEKKVQQDVERDMEPEIIDMLRSGKVPNLLEVVTENDLEFWNYDECAQFVKSGEIPDRCKNKRNNTSKKPAKSDDDFYNEEFTDTSNVKNTVNLNDDEDDLPF